MREIGGDVGSTLDETIRSGASALRWWQAMVAEGSDHVQQVTDATFALPVRLAAAPSFDQAWAIYTTYLMSMVDKTSCQAARMGGMCMMFGRHVAVTADWRRVQPGRPL